MWLATSDATAAATARLPSMYCSLQAQLAGGFVGDKALAVGEILHPERDLQQVVQLGAQPGIGAAATLLVLQQQGGFLFLAQFQRVGQVLQLELPRVR